MQTLCIRMFFIIVSVLASGVGFAEDAIRILAIDGGGARGVIPLSVIEQMEKDLKKPVTEIFDMVAGTSIGGLIALSLTAPGTITGKPMRSATEVLTSSFETSPRIFSASYRHWFGSAGGLWGPKYQSQGFESVLHETFHDLKLSQALIPTLVTGYHLEGESGIEFFSEDAREFPDDKDCLMREVAFATAAAPTFFDAVDVHYAWGTLNNVVDGGLYKHNPALLAYANAKRLYPDRKIEIYSLGTGNISAEELSSQLRGRGMLQWVSPILRHFTIGSNDADRAVLHKLLNQNGEENYFRLNVAVAQEHRSMDDVSPENLSYLYQRGIEATHSAIYRRMIERLKKE